MVREDRNGLPEAIRQGIGTRKDGWRQVARIEDCWTFDLWWLPKPLTRTYYRVERENGGQVTLFRDQHDGCWVPAGALDVSSNFAVSPAYVGIRVHSFPIRSKSAGSLADHHCLIDGKTRSPFMVSLSNHERTALRPAHLELAGRPRAERKSAINSDEFEPLMPEKLHV